MSSSSLLSPSWPRGLAAAAAVALVMASTPGRAQVGSLPDVAWLAGCWVSETAERTLEEVWHPPRRGVMVGVGRATRRGVPSGSETLRLQSVGQHLVLRAAPSGQPPADFRATVASLGLLRVENPDHDFPQAIEYAREDADTLVARVYGAVGDLSPAFVVVYARGPCASRRIQW